MDSERHHAVRLDRLFVQWRVGLSGVPDTHFTVHAAHQPDFGRIATGGFQVTS
jgi:hypothetical protein